MFTRDVWHDVLTSVDYTTGRYAVWIDGLQAFEADALSGVGHGLFAFHSFALFGAGDDQMHFDNYELSTRPVGDPVFGFGTNYCGPANTNSVGTSAEIASTGSRSASQNNLQLNASGMPAHSFGLFIASQTQGFVMSPGGSQGNLCLAGNVSRFMHQVQQSNNAGTFSIPVDLTAIPTPGGTVAVQAGETWNFQAWYRDVAPGGGATSNFTNGLSYTF